jgi:hypothetical protein
VDEHRPEDIGAGSQNNPVDRKAVATTNLNMAK